MPERDEFSPKPELSLGKYRHYKGGEYEVLTLACDEATHEWLVVYKALYDTHGTPDIWARTYENFTEYTTVNDNKLLRFSKIKE